MRVLEGIPEPYLCYDQVRPPFLHSTTKHSPQAQLLTLDVRPGRQAGRPDWAWYLETLPVLLLLRSMIKVKQIGSVPAIHTVKLN
jgi:hypothetical protein